MAIEEGQRVDFRRRTAATPTKPVPKMIRVAGSGTTPLTTGVMAVEKSTVQFAQAIPPGTLLASFGQIQRAPLLIPGLVPHGATPFAPKLTTPPVGVTQG